MRNKEYDILIIGSGASGGVMAKELSPLCKDGLKIAVLEWGAKLKEEDYTGRELDMVKKLYFDGGGMLTKDRSITIALGKAYGGSTVVYTGTSLMIPQEVLEGWNIPGLTYDDLKKRSEKYFTECNVHEMDPALINENNSLFYQACQKLGYNVGQFPVNVKGCKGAGMCNLGCPHQAKQGTHVVQLPEAEKNGVEVITNCHVQRIEKKTCYARIENADFGHPSAWEPGRYKIKAKLIILCAGAIHTPALLQYSGIGKDMPAMGRYITLHPALILAGQHEKAITNFYGHPKSYYCDHFTKDKRFILETCMYFPFTTSKSLTGFGADHAAMMAHMDRLQMIIVLVFDEPKKENRIMVDVKGKPIVDYTLSKEAMNSLFDSMVATAKILFASGAKRVHAPAGRKFFIDHTEQDRLESLMSRERLKTGTISLASAHVMGGCRMGDSAATSVTNSWGQVHGLPWLYIADSSIFPKCSEVNPYITIMALADRMAEHLKENAREILNS